MHEHQPDFHWYVTTTCQIRIAAERPWFRGLPVLATGPKGAGRTHAARRLARVVGVPHIILNLTDPVIASSIASSGRVSEALWASPITVAMAATRCANLVATVIGIDQVGDDVAGGLVAMIDAQTGRAWSEDQLGVQMDFGEVTWIVQCDDMRRVPPALRAKTTQIDFVEFPRGTETTAALSVLLEVLDDLRVDRADPAFDWTNIARALSGRHRSAKQLYIEMTHAVTTIARGDLRIPDDNEDDHLPF